MSAGSLSASERYDARRGVGIVVLCMCAFVELVWIHDMTSLRSRTRVLVMTFPLSKMTRNPCYSGYRAKHCSFSSVILMSMKAVCYTSVTKL
jgi:protein-S-isoprenylcysteine O-methyltransferase Ste14